MESDKADSKSIEEVEYYFCPDINDTYNHKLSELAVCQGSQILLTPEGPEARLAECR